MENEDPGVNLQSILAPHVEQTKRRMRGCREVYAIQDTSDLNFAQRPETSGLGVIGANQTRSKSLGLSLHSNLVVDESGATVGLLGAQCFAPGKALQARRGAHRDRVPIEEKESWRWIELYRQTVQAARQLPGLAVTAIMDREADIFELFREAAACQRRVHLLVRVQHNRCLEQSDENLIDRLRSAEADFEAQVRIPRQRVGYQKGRKVRHGKAARTATLAVHYEAVRIAAPNTPGKKHWPPLDLYAVYAREIHPPAGTKPIEWILLTTHTVNGRRRTVRMLAAYRRRWRIEEYHRVLKTGCRVEQLQLMSRERLERALGVLMVIAWRLMHLNLLGRKFPDRPCDQFLEPEEWQVLTPAAKKKRSERPPTLGEAILMIAKLGGYMGRKSDGPPGHQVLWLGLIRLMGMVEGYRLATGSMRHD